jgi:hypothetical protein
MLVANRIVLERITQEQNVALNALANLAVDETRHNALELTFVQWRNR